MFVAEEPEEAEESWGDFQRIPIVAVNWKSDRGKNIINPMTKKVLDKINFDPERIQVCVAP